MKTFNEWVEDKHPDYYTEVDWGRMARAGVAAATLASPFAGPSTTQAGPPGVQPVAAAQEAAKSLDDLADYGDALKYFQQQGDSIRDLSAGKGGAAWIQENIEKTLEQIVSMKKSGLGDDDRKVKERYNTVAFLDLILVTQAHKFDLIKAKRQIKNPILRQFIDSVIVSKRDMKKYHDVNQRMQRTSNGFRLIEKEKPSGKQILKTFKDLGIQ